MFGRDWFYARDPCDSVSGKIAVNRIVSVNSVKKGKEG